MATVFGLFAVSLFLNFPLGVWFVEFHIQVRARKKDRELEVVLPAANPSVP